MTTFPAECVLRAGAVLGEGPVWDVARQRLWWVDIESRELHSYGPAARNDRAWTFADRIGFGVPTTRGDFIVGVGSGLARFGPEKRGLVTALTDVEKELPGNRFNDAKCDPAGRLWAGTMAVSEEPGRGHLYRVDASLTVTRKVENVTVSNGLAWSLDGRTMYYIDSPTRRVDAFDFDPASGGIAETAARSLRLPKGFPMECAPISRGICGSRCGVVGVWPVSIRALAGKSRRSRYRWKQ